MPYIRKLRRVISLAVVIYSAAACQGRANATAVPTLTPVQLITQTPTLLPSIVPLVTTISPAPVETRPAATASATASATPTFPATVKGTPQPAQGQLPITSGQPKVTVAAENLPNPDDLLMAPDGTLYISVIGDGSIRRIVPGGSPETVVTGLSEPEGMALLPDGSLVTAEQGKNRLVKFDPQARAVTPFIQLKTPNNQLGVDGIALDAAGPTVIIPDSPNGNVLRASLDGQNLQTVASGLARPTGAWVESDGSILVVEEFGRSLLRIRPDGTHEMLASNLSEPDDVVEDSAGRIFVNTLADGAIHMLSHDGKQSQILANGLQSPQGIAVDADGNLFVTDSGTGRVLKIVLH